MKQGLSNRTVKSHASKNGFLKSIGPGFAPPILWGPFGWGGEERPWSIQLNSPPSGLEIISRATDSPSSDGSKRTVTFNSVPSIDSAGGAGIVGCSTEKSTATAGYLALGSTTEAG